MVELQQLSSEMAERRSGDSDGELMWESETSSRLLYDLDDEEEEWQMMTSDDLCTLWLDTCRPLRIEQGRVPDELFKQMQLNSDEYTGCFLCAGTTDAFDRQVILSHEIPKEAWAGVILLEQTGGSWKSDIDVPTCSSPDAVWEHLQVSEYGWYQLGGRDRDSGARTTVWSTPYKTELLLSTGDDCLRLTTSTSCWLTLGKRARHRKLDPGEVSLLSLCHYSQEESEECVQQLLESPLSERWTGQASELIGWPSSCARSREVHGHCIYEVMKADGEILACGFDEKFSPHVHYAKLGSLSLWSTSLDPLTLFLDEVKDRREALQAIVLWARTQQDGA
eukprot:6487901-Amphidinium_carterae.1